MFGVADDRLVGAAGEGDRAAGEVKEGRSVAPSVLTLDAALDGRLALVTSPLPLEEIAMVLGRPRLHKYVSAHEALRFVADLAAQTILLVDPQGPHPAVCRDPHDDYLVALARSSGAEAERGDDVEKLRRRRGGHPAMGSAAASVESVRRAPELKRELLVRAADPQISISEVIRRAIGQYLRAS